MSINIYNNQNLIIKTQSVADNSSSIQNKSVNSSFEQGLSMFNRYSKYFPTRSGEAINLGYTVRHPSYESMSAGKSFNEVAKDAREELNSQYKTMADESKPFNYNSQDGVDTNELFKNFDRRALFAVASNEGGNFSKQEQDMARSIMSSQLGLASGFYSGPARLQKEYVSSSSNNTHANQADAMLSFLNGVSDEEKNSGKWMLEVVGAENLKNSPNKETKLPKNDEFSFMKTPQNIDIVKSGRHEYGVNYSNPNGNSFAISA